MTIVDEILEANAAHAGEQGHRALSHKPAKQLTVITCMDCRIDPLPALGLQVGDAHILRNAGGAVTDDTIRSVAVSQRLLDTRHVVVIVHTACGMLGADESAFRRRLYDETGQTPTWSMLPYTHLETDLRSSLERLRTSPFLAHRDSVHGFVLDIDTSRLIPVR